MKWVFAASACLLCFSLESEATFCVVILCSDNDSTNPRLHNASLHVIVSDINDETPRFEYPAYQGRVRENEANAPVTHLSPSPTLRATDADVGRNALITFSLQEAGDETGNGHPSNASGRDFSGVGHFRIDPHSGRMWTVAALDTEEDISSDSKYVFYVVATDDGVPERRSSSALVTVSVDDVNDNPPAFERYHYNFEVPENSPVGTVVGRVSVRDADRTEVNRRVRFALRGRPEDLFLVDIDGAKGQLSMRRPVDFEKQSSISFTVIAENEAPLVTSSIAHQAEASVIISVLNLNDNRPEFVPIAPHRKHIIFTWEQLPVVDTNRTSEVYPRYCEPIPYKVVDKDCDPASQAFCCTLELESNFDGMFELLDEAPHALCVLRRPPQPQNYKVMLRARDGSGNGSLSSQIQLSVIVRSEPDYTKFTKKVSLMAPSWGPRIGVQDSGPESPRDERAERGRLGHPSQGAVRKAPSGEGARGSEDRDFAGAFSSPSPTTSLSSSAHQMKIISVLVSIAGIFCILLLVIIAALKCGLLDSQYFASTKTPENPHAVTEGEGLVAIRRKHEVLTMVPSGSTVNEEFRILSEAYPENVLCVDEKISTAAEAKRCMIREGTYDTSTPFSASSISTTNSGSSCPGGIMPGSRFIGSYQTVPASPNSVQPRKAATKPLLMSVLQPPDSVTLEVASRAPPKAKAYLSADGRLIPIEGAGLYTFSEAYQTLDPTTMKTKECSALAEGPKVTFNLEMLPMTPAGEAKETVGGFGRLLKNDIRNEEGIGDASKEKTKKKNKSLEDNRRDLVVYGKSTNHSSFV